MATTDRKPVGEAVLQDTKGRDGEVIPMGEWHITAPPHVLMRLKALFPRISAYAVKTVTLRHNPEACRDLAWFADRYPLTFTPRKALAEGCAISAKKIQAVERVLDAEYQPTLYDLAVPLRDYQAKATDLVVANRALLLADELGLGKTAVGVSLLSRTDLGPVVIVVQPHLVRQWKLEVQHFLPNAVAHVIAKTKPYELPPNVNAVICSYPKLRGWVDIFSRPPWKSIVFDEVQDLRHPDSGKHQAAAAIAQHLEYRLGLSATPFYNYGPELYHVIEILFPGFLGSFEEFKREWCSSSYEQGKIIIKDPAAFATYLSESGLFLRRTRRDVGRELPPMIETTCQVEHDPAVLDAIKGDALELAHRVLTAQDFHERGEASLQFDTKMRMATGIAKAPFVAEMVRLLVDEDPVIVFGWHREVYDIWNERLKDLNPVMYTGSESPKQKDESFQAFIEGRTKLIFVSLRSGAGLDGLQAICKTVVFGELDWSPGVISQCRGRVHRDQQKSVVRVFYPMTDVGSDPMMAQVLGLKRAQIEGIFRHDEPLVANPEAYKATLKEMAKEYIRRHSHTHSPTKQIS